MHRQLLRLCLSPVTMNYASRNASQHCQRSICIEESPTCIYDGTSTIVCTEQYILVLTMLLKDGFDACAVIHYDSIYNKYNYA